MRSYSSARELYTVPHNKRVIHRFKTLKNGAFTNNALKQKLSGCVTKSKEVPKTTRLTPEMIKINSKTTFLATKREPELKNQVNKTARSSPKTSTGKVIYENLKL